MQLQMDADNPDTGKSRQVNPLIMPGHSNPSEPEIVVAVRAEEGKGAVPGEVNNGGGAQVGCGGEEEFGGGAMCQVTGAEKVKVKWKVKVHTGGVLCLELDSTLIK